MLAKKSILSFIAMVILFLVVIVFAYRRGQEDVWKYEYKECKANLIMVMTEETNHTTELKDYIKARYYYLSNKLPRDYVSPAKDYGPIGTNLKHLAVFKDPSTGEHEYQMFRQKFDTSKTSQ